jgi:hypothetical protein
MHGPLQKANLKQPVKSHRFCFGGICYSACLHRNNQHRLNTQKELNTYGDSIEALSTQQLDLNVEDIKEVLGETNEI